MAKKRKRIAKNEFRYNYNTKHPNFVFEQDGNKYYSVGLTHHKRTFDKRHNRWRKNMPLEDRVQKTKLEKTFIRYGIIKQDKRTFGNVDKRYSFSTKDNPKIKSKIRNFKNNRRKM